MPRNRAASLMSSSPASNRRSTIGAHTSPWTWLHMHAFPMGRRTCGARYCFGPASPPQRLCPSNDESSAPRRSLALKTERIGHEMPGLHGVYGHMSAAMRADLCTALQERWEAPLGERARLNPRSIIPVLDRLLAAQRAAGTKIGSHLAPRVGHGRRGSRA